MIKETLTATAKTKPIERVASGLSMAGAFLISLNNEYSKMAYVLWLFSNPMHVYVMAKSDHLATAAKDTFFIGTTIIGLYTWWL